MKRHHRLPRLAACARLAVWFCSMAAIALQLTPAPALSAAIPPARWEPARTPSHEGLVVLPGSDIDRFCNGGGDGRTLYAIGMWNSPCADVTPDDPYAPDGMLFDPGQAPRLWKSSDGGTTWEDRTPAVLSAANLPDAGTGEYDDFLVFTAVASAPDDADVVLVAGYNKNGNAVVAASHSGAEQFEWLGCGAIEGVILCAAISPAAHGMRDVAVGTTDAANGGRVWRLEAGDYWSTAWVDTSTYAGWDDTEAWGGDPAQVLAVTSLAFSAGYADDHALAATVIAYAEEPDGAAYDGYYVALGCWDVHPAWNAEAGFVHHPVLIDDTGHVIRAPAALPLLLLRDLASVALPADFDADLASKQALLVAVNGSLINPTVDSIMAEGGFLYWLQQDSLSGDLLAQEGNPWVASVAYLGDCDMRGSTMVGTWLPDTWSIADIEDWFSTGAPELPCCGGVRVLLSRDNDPCCPRWDTADRPPSGQFNAQVAWLRDGETAVASTAGAGRLWHGSKWYADESAFSIAAAPQLNWEQTGLIDTMIHRIVDISHDASASILYLHTAHAGEAGTVCKCESVWKSTSEGARWRRMLHGRPAVSDDDDDAFDDLLGKYRRGFFKPVTEGYLSAGGARYIIGDAIDPDVEEQVEAGLDADAIYRAAEGGGAAWKAISELVLDYEGLIYLSCPGSPGGVLYSGFDDLWWDYTDNRPLPYPSDGSDPVLPAGHDCRKVSGAARVLAPDRPACCLDYDWDYLIRGLVGTDDPDGVYEHLSLAGGSCDSDSVRLWAIDKGNRYWADGGDEGQSYDWCAGRFVDSRWGRLWQYDDCYAVAATGAIAPAEPLTVPSDPCRCAHEEFILEWERTCDACGYDVQIAYDRQFNHILVTTSTFLHDETAAASERFYLPPDPCGPSLLVPQGTLDCNQTYWWRVRAHLAETHEVIASWWSEPQVFHTAPGPPGGLALHAPGDGATGVPVAGVAFTWSTVSGATRYDFMLVDRDRGHVASQVWDNSYFILPLELEHDTPYVWRVLALDGDRVISESARATFRTAPAPAAPDYAVTGPAIVPPAPAAHDNLGWYVAGALGVLLTAAMVALSWVNHARRRMREAIAGHQRRHPRHGI